MWVVKMIQPKINNQFGIKLFKALNNRFQIKLGNILDHIQWGEKILINLIQVEWRGISAAFPSSMLQEDDAAGNVSPFSWGVVPKATVWMQQLTSF